MSYTSICRLPPKGDMIKDHVEYGVYRNAWGGAMVIWKSLWEKYCRQSDEDKFPLGGDLEPLWGLTGRDDVELWEKFLLQVTCDGVIFRSKAIPLLAKCFDAFTEEHAEALEGKVWHGVEMAEDLRKLHEEFPEDDVFLIATSVSGICGADNPLYIPE